MDVNVNDTDDYGDVEHVNYSFSIELVDFGDGSGFSVSLVLPIIDKAICLSKENAVKLAYALLQSVDELNSREEGVKI